jgi:hypothetical protein
MSRFWVAVWLLAVLASPASAQVVRVSVSTSGAEADGASRNPSVSATGRFVVFDSLATNLVGGDTNNTADVFLRDRDTDADGIFDEAGAVATSRLSVGANGAQLNGQSYAPAITPNGRYVVYQSSASNLVPGSTPDDSDVYRLDRLTGTTIRVLSRPLGPSLPVVSDDGNFVAAVVMAASQPFLRVAIADIAAGTTTVLPPPYELPDDITWPSRYFNYNALSITGDGTRIGVRVGVYYYHGAYFVDPRYYVYDRASGVFTLVATPSILTTPFLSATGTSAIVPSADRTTRRVLASGAESPLCSTTPSIPAFAASPTLRHVVSRAGLLCDIDRDLYGPLGVVPDSLSFSGNDRFVAVATETGTLPGVTDGNFISDVYVFDLPDFFDADGDTMDDRWEALFGISDPGADPDADGQTNAQEEDAGTHPNGQVRRFLAEGATGAFFRNRIGLANPSATDAVSAVLSFDTAGGGRVRRPVSVPAGRSTVIDVGALQGLEAADVSTTVESSATLGVERAMAWGPSLDSLYGSHAETAAPAPSTTWFLAEGSTVLDFNLFYLLQNPEPTPTQATVRYLRPSGAVITRTYDLPPGSRTTVYVNLVPGLEETDVSAGITADAPIVVERAMYRDLPNQPFGLGHGAMGVTAAAPSWFLAEGATGPFFDLYVLIANPTDADATVQARYAKPDGSVVTQNYPVRANSRHSVFVDAIPGLENTAVATTLTSTTGAVPIVAERAMYWPGGFFDYYEGHASPGTTTTARSWIVGGGERGGGSAAQTYVLVANTDNRIGEATITVLPDVGFAGDVPAPVIVPLPATSRTTIPISQIAGTFGVLVASTGTAPVELVVESATYRDVGGVTWAAGSNALATPVP